MMTEKCGSPHYWSSDTAEETGVILDLYYANQDLVSMHFYGCATSGYSYCTGVANMTIYDVAKAASVRLGKPLYVGEFGASNTGPNDGYNATNSSGVAYFEAATHAIAMQGIPLSTMWAWVCPSHGDTPNWYVMGVGACQLIPTFVGSRDVRWHPCCASRNGRLDVRLPLALFYFTLSPAPNVFVCYVQVPQPRSALSSKQYIPGLA
jgi:hypothetical protein